MINTYWIKQRDAQGACETQSIDVLSDVCVTQERFISVLLYVRGHQQIIKKKLPTTLCAD